LETGLRCGRNNLMRKTEVRQPNYLKVGHKKLDTGLSLKQVCFLDVPTFEEMVIDEHSVHASQSTSTKG